jgi:hypothetical protein
MCSTWVSTSKCPSLNHWLNLNVSKPRIFLRWMEEAVLSVSTALLLKQLQLHEISASALRATRLIWWLPRCLQIQHAVHMLLILMLLSEYTTFFRSYTFSAELRYMQTTQANHAASFPMFNAVSLTVRRCLTIKSKSWAWCSWSLRLDSPLWWIKLFTPWIHKSRIIENSVLYYLYVDKIRRTWLLFLNIVSRARLTRRWDIGLLA